MRRLFFTSAGRCQDYLFNGGGNSQQTFGGQRLGSSFNDRQELPNRLTHSWVVGNLTEQCQITADVLMEDLTEVQDVALRSV